MHTKHSNTVFPGDNVRVTAPGKTASVEHGRVVGASPDTGKVKIAYDDGRTDWVDMDRLEKA